MTDTTAIVARQYTAYSYPHPIADMREAIDRKGASAAWQGRVF